MSAKIDLINKIQEGNYLFVFEVIATIIFFLFFIELIKNLLVRVKIVENKKSVKTFLISYAVALTTFLAIVMVYETFTAPIESEIKTVEIVK